MALIKFKQKLFHGIKKFDDFTHKYKYILMEIFYKPKILNPRIFPLCNHKDSDVQLPVRYHYYLLSAAVFVLVLAVVAVVTATVRYYRYFHYYPSPVDCLSGFS
jgi:hypothetical protein